VDELSKRSKLKIVLWELFGYNLKSSRKNISHLPSLKYENGSHEDRKQNQHFTSALPILGEVRPSCWGWRPAQILTQLDLKQTAAQTSLDRFKAAGELGIRAGLRAW